MNDIFISEAFQSMYSEGSGSIAWCVGAGRMSSRQQRREGGAVIVAEDNE
jgi:hypothetical protein